jgi:ubiquinone/menaquinone biosynthesis C-methylase UbiE
MAVPFDTHRLITLVPIKPYDHVADIGCGDGKHSVRLAKHLFSGRVFALDVEESKLETARAAIKQFNLTNVKVMLSDHNKLPLEEACLDGAVLSKVLHHANNPKKLLAEARRCLKKTGWASVIENYSGDHSVSEPKLWDMVSKAGYRRIRQHSLDSKQYMLIMRK